MKNSILLLGSTGLVGEAMYRMSGEKLIRLPKNILTTNDSEGFKQIIKENDISTVVNCAAHVRGIEENKNTPHEMYEKNAKINSFVIDNIIQNSVENYILFGSNCMYSRDVEQPYSEDVLMQFNPAPTNYGFAGAKFASYYQAKSASMQYKFKLFFPIPCSLYGRNDNYKYSQSHVVAAVVRKLCDAKLLNETSITFWGSGNAKREIMHADNILSAINKMLECDLYNHPINIGSGEEMSIRELVNEVSGIIGYKGKIYWDSEKPDGAPRKILDSSTIRQTGWEPKIRFQTGLKATVSDYLEQKCQRL